MKAKTAINVLAVICMLFVAWVVISIIDVYAHNLTTCEYLPFNIFSVLYGIN